MEKMASPTFVALFEDGLVTRMTTHCENGKLDLKRGIALARIAYEKRTSNPPPPIAAAKFIEPGYNDTVLEEYDAKALLEDGEVVMLDRPRADRRQRKGKDD